MNYAQLKIRAASLLDNRQDDDIDTLMTQAVEMAEERLNEDLRVREMLVTVPTTLIEGVGALPDDYLAFVAPKDGDVDLVIGDDTFTVTPTRWAEPGDYDLKYYARIPALSVSNPTNKILAKFSNLYLFATCTAGALNWEAQGGPMTAKFEGAYQQALSRARKTDLRARFNTQNRRHRSARP